MPRVAHFDVSADQPGRVIRFYEEVFGWKAEKWTGPFDYWLVKTGDPSEPGIDGGVAPRTKPGQGVTPVIDVPSVDDSLAKIEAAGGTIVEPKRAIPSVGYFAAFKDTEGNLFGLMEADEAAS